MISATIRSIVTGLVALDHRICGRSTSRAAAPTGSSIPFRSVTPDVPVLDDLDSVVAMVAQHPDPFLRYSKGPAADAETVSRDYEADVGVGGGLSVTTIAPEAWWPLPTEDWVARRLFKYDELGQESGRFPWLLSGRRVATGPDHEPIVELHHPVAIVGDEAIRQARQRYRRRFAAGENSTE